MSKTVENLRAWPLTTVVKRDRFTRKLTIDDVEVEYDHENQIYVEKPKEIDKSKVIYA